YAALVQAADVALKGKDYAKARAALAPAASFGISALAEKARGKLAEIDSREKQAAQWVKWDAIKAGAAKLTTAGKFDEAIQAIAAAKALPLDDVADLIATETASIEAARQKAAEALAAAYAAESDKVWALFKQRKYAEADTLLAALADKKGGAAYQADLEAAKALKEFWGRVEAWVVSRKGKLVSIAGAAGNVASVKDGVVTLERGGATFTRRVDQLAWTQALAYAGLKADERSNLLKGVFLLAEQQKLEDAEAALAAAGNRAYSQRLGGIREPEVGGEPVAVPAPKAAGGWKSLFDGKTLRGWRVLTEGKYVKPGKVHVLDGQLVMGRGGPATPIVWTEGFPTVNYEVRVVARITEGTDLFNGITFPFKDTRCVLTVGGDKGTHVGLGMIDGRGVRDNATRRGMKAVVGQWYAIRLRVTDDRIAAWIDDEKVVDLPTRGRKLGTDPASVARLLSPFGFVTFVSTVGIRSVEVRRLPAAPKPRVEAPRAGKWQSLFDGKMLRGWRPILKGVGYAGAGRVTVKDRAILFAPGKPNTGIQWMGDFPRNGYELVYEAAKLKGISQFGCAWFPVGESHCELILGAGPKNNIVGLSDLDGKWAGENVTLMHMRFDHKQWYVVRIHVTDERIEAWVGEQKVVDLPRAGQKFDRAAPPEGILGISSYANTSSVRSIRVRTLAK
ncbi:DUF1080 domain-containing protein, partial [bacterium]|nr:DUF1080 domain-containing protein [bacterium]